MKICPQCQSTYTDDGLQFCMEDGTPLNFANTTQLPTTSWTESETVISPRRATNQQNEIPQTVGNTWHGEIPQISSPPPARKSNKAQILILAALALFLFVGIVAAGTWILIRNMQREVANTNRPDSPTPSPSNTNRPANQPVNNSNQSWNGTTPTPTPKPTLRPEEITKAKANIADAVSGWRNGMENLDLNSHMSYYADTVDYYRSGRVSVAKVRADKQRAYDMYDTIDVSISNSKTTLNDAGDRATVVFDKEWLFENDEKTNSGKVQQELQFEKIGGKWRITGEKDLKVYYVNK